MSDNAGIIPVTPVIYGKHPAYGDFLAHGLEHGQFLGLDQWLEAVLPPLKAGLGDSWEAAWRYAPVLRFWIGPDVFGVPLFGIFIASRDKVSRRYPLMFCLTGLVPPPPIHPSHDEKPYDVLSTHIGGFEVPRDGTRGAKTLLTGFEVPAVLGTPFEDGFDGVLWGSRHDGDLARLFQDARSADYDKSQLARSHWWHPADDLREAGWLAVNGLPDTQALNWLLTGRLRPPEPKQTAAPDTRPKAEDVQEGTAQEVAPAGEEDNGPDKNNIG